jgi:hypothetical protein
MLKSSFFKFGPIRILSMGEEGMSREWKAGMSVCLQGPSYWLKVFTYENFHGLNCVLYNDKLKS